MEENYEQVVGQDLESSQSEQEEIVIKMAELVRSNSAAVKLTRSEDFLKEPINVLEEELDDKFTQLLAFENNIDIEVVKGSKQKFLFSTRSITKSYAILLARVEEKDMKALIAGTVRDESKIYPRPTTVKTFLEPPFNLAEEEIKGVIAQMKSGVDFLDIKDLTTSNGAVYLYSTKYLSDVYAKSLAEDIEMPPSE